jgi:hypothetical protein
MLCCRLRVSSIKKILLHFPQSIWINFFCHKCEFRCHIYADTLCVCVCVCVCVCAHAHGAEDWTRALCVLSKWSTTGLYPSPGLFLIDVYEWCALPFIPLSILRLSSYLCLVFCFIWVSSDTDFFYFKIVYFSIFAVFDILLYLQAIKIISVLLKVVKFFFLYPEF